MLVGDRRKHPRTSHLIDGVNTDTINVGAIVRRVADFARLVEAMKANPAQVRFRVAVKVATHYFGEPRQRGTSHRVWKTPWPGDPRVSLQCGQGGMAKIYQVRQLLAAMDRLGPTTDEG